MALENRAFGDDVSVLQIDDASGTGQNYVLAFKNFRMSMSRQRMVSRAAKDRSNPATGYGWEYGRPKSTEITLDITTIMAGEGSNVDLLGPFGNAIGRTAGGLTGPMNPRQVTITMFGKTFNAEASISGFSSDFPGEAAEESISLTFSSITMS